MSDVSLVSPAVAPAADAASPARVRPPRERPMVAISGTVGSEPAIVTLPSGATGVCFRMFAGREEPASMVVAFPDDATGERARRFVGDFGKASASIDGAERRAAWDGLGVDATIAGRWRKGVPVEGKSTYWFEGVDAGVGKDLPMPVVDAAARAAEAKAAAAEKAAAEKAPAREPAAVVPAGPLSDADRARMSDPASLEQALRASKTPSTKDPQAFILVVSADQAKGAGGDALSAVAPLAGTARDAARDARLNGGYRALMVPYAAMATKLAEAGPDAAAGFLREMPEAAKQSSKNGSASHAMYRAMQAKAGAGAER